jgi:hypothetical protein
MALFAASELAMAMRPKGWWALSHGRSSTGHSLAYSRDAAR